MRFKMVHTRRPRSPCFVFFFFFYSHSCYSACVQNIKAFGKDTLIVATTMSPKCCHFAQNEIIIFFSWSISLFMICSHFLRLVSFLAEIVKFRRRLFCLQQNSLKDLQISKCLDGQLISGMTGFVAIRSMQRQECVQNSQSKFKRKEAFCHLRQLIPGSILRSWICL